MNDDVISRQAAIDAMWEIRRQQQMLDDTHKADLVMRGIHLAEMALEQLPSAQPTYTDAEIQKMQDLESAQIEKAYQLGYEEGKKDAQQDRKTAHWVLLDECSNSGYYCSKCHKKVVKEGWSSTVKKIKFCPNCGSPMEGTVYDV